MLILEHGGEKLGFPVRRALDIVTLSDELLPADDPAVRGITVIDGVPIEVIDMAALARRAGTADVTPICLVQGADSAWTDTMLRPMIEAAGYRVAQDLQPGETAAVTLVAGDDPAPAGNPAGNVVRLPRDTATGRPAIDAERLAQALATGDQR